MNKIAQILKDHIKGTKTVSSEKIMSQVKKQLKEAGFKAPYKISRFITQDELLEKAKEFKQKAIVDPEKTQGHKVLIEDGNIYIANEDILSMKVLTKKEYQERINQSST